MFTAPVLALLLAAAPNDTYTLKWKLNQGDVFYNKSNVTTDQTVEVMGRICEKAKASDIFKSGAFDPPGAKK